MSLFTLMEHIIRDWMVGNITKNFVSTPSLTNTTIYTGTTEWSGYTYETKIVYTPGLLQNTNLGVNHNASVGATTNSTDGLVAVLEVTITGAPPVYKSYVISSLVISVIWS